ncbi:MAG: PQQ-binding-like beta-propeller repeat protein [Planctomycetota bacterium]|nr:PQQ-binding-like beta-propeller repeat protein [Planctomycetota bacterium]
MNRTTCAIAPLLLLFASGLHGQDWSVFRGPRGDGSSASKNLPVQWSPTDNIAWKTPLPGQGWSSPVLRKGLLYLTNAVAKQSDAEKPPYLLNALAIDAKTGKIIWTTQLFEEPSNFARVHSKNSHASPTPIVTKDGLFVHFGHLGTASLTLDGQIKWKTLPMEYSPVHGNGGTPVYVKGGLIFSVDGQSKTRVICLDGKTGKTNWQFDRESTAPRKFSFSTPAVITLKEQTQIISPGSNVVHSLDAETGQLIWKVRYDGYSVIPKPVFHQGLLYVSTGYDSPSLYCIDPSGSGDVTETHVRWNIQRQIPHTSSLILEQGRIFMISDRGIGSCLDAGTGDTLWQQRVGGNFSSSPIINNGLVYFTSEQGDTTVIKASASYEMVATNSLGERTLASPAATDGAIYIRTAGHLFCIKQ